MRQDLREKHGMGAIAKLSLPAIRTVAERGPVLIDAIYNAEESDVYRHEFGVDLILFAVSTTQPLRVERLARRLERPLTTAAIEARDRYELETLRLDAVMAGAGHCLCNDGTAKDLMSKLARLSESLRIR